LASLNNAQRLKSASLVWLWLEEMESLSAASLYQQSSSVKVLVVDVPESYAEGQ